MKSWMFLASQLLGVCKDTRLLSRIIPSVRLNRMSVTKRRTHKRSSQKGNWSWPNVFRQLGEKTGHTHNLNGLFFFLGHESRGGTTLVLPGGRKDALRLVIAGQSVDARLDQNQSEFGIAVLTIALQVLADGYGLLDQEIQVFWQLWGEAFLLQDTQHFVAGHETNLSNSVRVSEDDTC